MAATLTYVRAFTSGGLEPFWPHFWLLFASVLASCAVGAGILLERPKYSASIHRIATWLVIWGVVIEVICTICLFVFDEGVSGAQQSKIIALESKIAARSLRNEDIVALNNALKSVSGTFIDVYIFPAGTPDTVPLGRAIAAVLKHAGWDIGRIETASGGQYFVGIGIWLKPNAEEKVKKAHAALIKALAIFDPNLDPDMSVTAGAFSVEGLSPGIADWTRLPAPLAVLVGTKP